MEKHLNLKDLMHWYDRSEIEERCILPLHLDILRGDPNFIDEWPSIIEDLYCKSTQTLSCMSLAMHNVIVKSNAEFQYKKIYAR